LNKIVSSTDQNVFAQTFTCKAALISIMPVFLIKSGRLKGGFSIPLLPCKYLRLKHQWRGTGTEFLKQIENIKVMLSFSTKE